MVVFFGDSITRGHRTSSFGNMAPCIRAFRFANKLNIDETSVYAENGLTSKEILNKMVPMYEAGVATRNFCVVTIGHNDAKIRRDPIEFSYYCNAIQQRLSRVSRRVYWNVPLFIHSGLTGGVWSDKTHALLWAYIEQMIKTGLDISDHDAWTYFRFDKQPDGVHPNDRQSWDLGMMWGYAINGKNYF